MDERQLREVFLDAENADAFNFFLQRLTTICEDKEPDPSNFEIRHENFQQLIDLLSLFFEVHNKLIFEPDWGIHEINEFLQETGRTPLGGAQLQWFLKLANEDICQRIRDRGFTL